MYPLAKAPMMHAIVLRVALPLFRRSSFAAAAFMSVDMASDFRKASTCTPCAMLRSVRSETSRLLSTYRACVIARVRATLCPLSALSAACTASLLVRQM